MSREIQIMTSKYPLISRRSLVAGAALGIASIVMPKSAYGSTTDSETMGQKAHNLWLDAVRKAKEQGVAVSDRMTHTAPTATPRTYTTGRADMAILNWVQPDRATAIAVYDALSNGNIGEVYDAWVVCMASTVENLTYQDTKLDQGRTLCVNYTCSLRNTITLGEAFEFYAEFYNDGSGWMSGGVV